MALPLTISMTNKWSRKKRHFPLLALLLVFLACSVLYNEFSIQQIHQSPDHVHHTQQQTSSFTYVKPNLPQGASGVLSYLKSSLSFPFLWIWPKTWSWVLEVLDRSSSCNSTRNYSGKKIRWASTDAESNQRRSISQESSCDVFSGKWVFDNQSYPLYKESDCPYMSDQLACHKHGRSDLQYQHWSWQPHNCNLKR